MRKEVGLEINVEKSKLFSRYQNAGHIRVIKLANRSFGNMSQLKYLGATATSKNLL
jgi:hypothetical protein